MLWSITRSNIGESLAIVQIAVQLLNGYHMVVPGENDHKNHEKVNWRTAFVQKRFQMRMNNMLKREWKNHLLPPSISLKKERKIQFFHRKKTTSYFVDFRIMKEWHRHEPQRRSRRTGEDNNLISMWLYCESTRRFNSLQAIYFCNLLHAIATGGLLDGVHDCSINAWGEG